MEHFNSHPEIYYNTPSCKGEIEPRFSTKDWMKLNKDIIKQQNVKKFGSFMLPDLQRCKLVFHRNSCRWKISINILRFTTTLLVAEVKLS